MNNLNPLKKSTFLSLFLIIFLLGINPKEGKSCIDPDSTITVTMNYNQDYTEVAIILGNLNLMTEQPNVFCSCALVSVTGFFTYLNYVAFVETGTSNLYSNMEPWVNTAAADQAWGNALPFFGDWSGFIAQVINDGLAPQDDVELIIRASTPPGYFVDVSDMDSTLTLSYLGTDAWDPVEEDLIAAHQGVRNLGLDNSSKEFNELPNSYFTDLDDIILSNKPQIKNLSSFSVFPNPSNGSFQIKYNLKEVSFIKVNVRDLSGKLIYSNSIGQQSIGDQNLEIDLPKGKLNNGLYFIEIANEFESEIIKLLIAK